MVFVVLCPETPEGSTGGGSGFKASQKTGQRLKVSSDRLCCLWPCSLAVPVLAGWVYAFCGSMSRNSRKAQPAVVLVLKRFRRRGNSLKSHPTDWEKPGIEPTDFALIVHA